MKSPIAVLFFYFFFIPTLPATCQTSLSEAHEQYKPDNKKLYDTIVYLDSLFFGAYNTCDMKLQAEFYDDDIEFYHDKGGLMTSKADILNAIKNNICGKVNRELVRGSIEVYPLGDYGAVEMGIHKFHNLEEGTTSEGGKFVVIWRHDSGKWSVSRVISLH